MAVRYANVALNFKNVTIAFAVVAVLLAAAGGIYFVSSGGLERGHLYYHGNGGSCGDSDVDCTYDHIVWGVDFEKSGYILSSWNSEADGTGTSYNIGSYINYDKDTHIYAQWVSVAEYNCVYVSAYSGDVFQFPDLTLSAGTETVVLKEKSYLLTKEPTAYITISEYDDWTYKAYNDSGFFLAERTDPNGDYYCAIIYAEYATGLSIDGNKMCMNIENNANLKITLVADIHNEYESE